MKFLLDTNTCIIYIRGKNAALKQKLETTATKDIAVCSIVKAELFYGAMKSANPERNLTLQQEFLAQFISYQVRIISYDSHSHCTPPPTPPRKRGGETKRSFGGVGFLGFSK